MTRISSRIGYRSCISRTARRTIGPIVSASLRVGRTRLTVSPCLSLSDASRARSPNSEWWKLASANQRSTRAGTARDSSAARSAATSVSAFCAQLLERLAADGLPGLDDDHRRSRALGDRLRERPEQRPARLARRRRRTHHDEVRLVGLAQDRGPDVGGLAQEGLRLGGHELAGERREGVLGLRPDGLRDARRHEVHDDDRRVVAHGERVGEAQRELGVRAAAHRDQDPADLAGAALLHDRDVARGLAHDLVDGRADDRAAAGITARAGLAAPAEDHQVGLLLRRRLDDAGRRVPADPDERVDDRALGDVVQDLLEEAPCLPGPGRALGQRHALGHLDDAQRRQLAGSRLQERRADADQLLRGQRVGDRDQDPGGQRLCGHAPAPAAPAARQRSTR